MNKKYDIHDLGLPNRAVRVYGYLCRKSNAEGVCSPLVGTIAKALQVSERTVFRALNDLECADMIERSGRYRAGGGRQSSTYRVGGDVHGLDQ